MGRSGEGSDVVREMACPPLAGRGEPVGSRGCMVGPLIGGPPVSPVDFKKWQCPLSLFLKCPCRF